MPKKKILEKGQDIDAYCDDCQVNTDHSIVTIKKNSASLVICKICKDKHDYLKPKKAEKKKSTSKASSRRSSKSNEAKWGELISSFEQSEAVKYAMTGDYAENSLIKHSLFGLGVITKRVDSTRAEVLFENEVKLMAMNRK